MYKAYALSHRLEVLGLTKAVGELGVQKLLSFLDSGGQTLQEVPQGGFSTPVVVVYDPRKKRGASLRASSSVVGGGGGGGGAQMMRRRGSSIGEDYEERRRTSHGGDLNSSSMWGLDMSANGSSVSPKIANSSYSEASRRKARARAEAESMLFMETDRGGCGTWHEESMEVLCIHSAV